MVIECVDLPGLTWPPTGAEHHNLHIALATKSREPTALVVPGRPWMAADPVPGNAPSARWEVPVTVRQDADGFDIGGTYVRGDRADRHLFIAWGTCARTGRCS